HAVSVMTRAPLAAPTTTAPEGQPEQPEQAEHDEQEPEEAEDPEAPAKSVGTVAVVVVRGCAGGCRRQVGAHAVRPADVVGDHAHDGEKDHSHHQAKQTETASHVDSLLCERGLLCAALILR